MCHESPGSGSDAAIVQTLFNQLAVNITNQNYNVSLFGENDAKTGYRAKYEVSRGFGTTMYIFLTPFLVMLGVLGNLLSVFVFFRSKLRPHSASQYLSALAVSDSLFLILLLPPWLSTIELNGLFHRNGFCQIFVYVSYVACCVSAWLVIAFTVERFVAVQYPLHRNLLCTAKRARCLICIIVTISLVVNTPILLFAGPGEEECNINRDKLAHAEMFNWLDTIMSFTVPLVIIIFLNTWIIIAIWRLQKERKRLLQEESELPPSNPRARAACHVGYTRCQQRVTKMLLIVSSAFVFFNLPAYVMRVLAYVYDVDPRDADERWAVVHHASAILFNANFGINFFLYCFNGQNFRRALRQVVPCCARFARPQPAARDAAAGAAPATAGRARTRAHFRARPTSFTTSAASTSTVATCLPPPASSRRLRRPNSANFIFRWTFNNATAARRPRPRPDESHIETIEMHEIAPHSTTVRPLILTDQRNI